MRGRAQAPPPHSRPGRWARSRTTMRLGYCSKHLWSISEWCRAGPATPPFETPQPCFPELSRGNEEPRPLSFLEP